MALQFDSSSANGQLREAARRSLEGLLSSLFSISAGETIALGSFQTATYRRLARKPLPQ